MRRAAFFLSLVAALGSAVTAAAALEPIHRTFGDLTIPLVRAGAIRIPPGHASGRTTVIVDLPLPPLAASGRGLAVHGAARHLDVASASARAYLARIAAAQRAAVAQLHRAIPAARVGRRFGILLDGITVDLPARKLPALLRLGFVTHVYSSERYTLQLNDSPSVIGATELEKLTGANGAGVKVAIVDDGIDANNPFFDPAGYSYPPGFPKGQPLYATPKVIVARSFPGPGAGPAGALPLDRKSSFHGTHVAGIVAGDAGTTAPAPIATLTAAGPYRQAVTGLSGVAPRAWLGNYRVFTVPTPTGDVANTPEIVAAFEAAVADGMQVINFSGGGPEIDPVNDALIEATANLVAAGVVSVFSAGNDRDSFGLGTVGSPASAPDAIAVAAVSNAHVFAPAMTVLSPAIPGGLPQIPVQPDQNGIPPAWGTLDQTLVDVSTLVGTDGRPVDRFLCGPPGDPNRPVSTLAPHTLEGAIALVWRGNCTFVSKDERARAAGAAGLIVVDNRPGEALFPGFLAPFPTGFIADLDGARLHDALAATGGRATIRVTREPQLIETGRSGVPTEFSAAGPTDFSHLLKPDISAPGGQILSATLTEFAGAPFAVFDGTSMSAPHISGAAALLLQRHPAWTPTEVKSALMDSAGPAWSDTARTTEANVELEGAGLANVVAADDPRLFTDPQSISFPDLDVNHGAASRGTLLLVSDAGGGAGSWQVSVSPQTASPGASLDVPSTIDLPPGGETTLPVVAHAEAGAVAGDETGFIMLTQGTITRRVPYLFSVTRPALESEAAVPLQQLQIGDTRTGENRASVYRWPSGGLGRYGQDILGPTHEDGAEHLYVIHVNDAVVNLGVSVVASSAGSIIDPWFLGSKDENDVQGYAGTPTNVNSNSLVDYETEYGAAGVQFPRQKEFFVAVDSGRDPFTGRSLAGRYLLRAWVNDLDPPLARVMTTRVAAGRPTLVARTLDPQSGVDPFSLAISYGQVTILAALYDPVSGIVIFPLPPSAPVLKSGSTRTVFVASDFEEGKNINSVQPVLPNTAFVSTRLHVVNGPAITWVQPDPHMCVPARAGLLAVASATRKIRNVRFLDGRRQIGIARRGVAGLYSAVWRTAAVANGAHTLTAVVTDARGAQATAVLDVKVCNARRHRHS